MAEPVKPAQQPVEAEVKIKQIIRRTHNVKTLVFDVENRAGFLPGQYLLLILNTETGIKKPLTISCSPDQSDRIEVTKKVTESPFSKLYDSLREGDTVKIKYPYGKFIFSDVYKKAVFLAGGIGITPFMSMLSYIVNNQVDTDIALFYGNKTTNDIVYRNELELIGAKNPNIKIVHVIQEPDADWRGYCGLITSGIIKSELADYTERDYFICGPPIMTEAMTKMLKDELGIDENRILREQLTGY